MAQKHECLSVGYNDAYRNQGSSSERHMLNFEQPMDELKHEILPAANKTTLVCDDIIKNTWLGGQFYIGSTFLRFYCACVILGDTGHMNGRQNGMMCYKYFILDFVSTIHDPLLWNSAFLYSSGYPTIRFNSVPIMLNAQCILEPRSDIKGNRKFW